MSIIVLTFLGIAGWIGNDVFIEYESKAPSKSKGTRVDGSLLNGKRLPSSGPNFETYSRLLSAVGRTCVHEKVRAAVVGSYALVYEKAPELRFVYGETGWCRGGEFWPHRTHQNGLSVDFMVPVRRGEAVDTIPSTIIDGWGYKTDFTAPGRYGEFEIDYEAMALHLLALDESARQNGLTIDRVIFAPDLQAELKKAKRGKKVLRTFDFNEDPVWVRHDDHYHVDFRLKEGAQSETIGFDNVDGTNAPRDPAPRQDWDSL